MQGLLMLGVLLHDHLPLGQVPNHHSSFNQSVTHEMTCFVQTVCPFVPFPLRDPFVDVRKMEVASRLLLAAVPLGADLVKLFVIPASPFEAADVIEPASSVVSDGQRFDA